MLFDSLEALLTYNVLNTAGVLDRNLLIYSERCEPFCKERMTLIHFICYFTALFSKLNVALQSTVTYPFILRFFIATLILGFE